FEVIVVDNASADGSADWVAARYGHDRRVRLLRQTANLGFGGGCNAGLAQARGDVLVLLNQDTEVRPDWLAALVDALAAGPAIGIAGSKALYPDGTLQHAGGHIDTQGNGSHLGYRRPDQGQFDRPADVDYVTGASLALRRDLYDAIGGFDEGFGQAYCEDMDLCLRARAAGWRVVYAPRSVLVHKEESRAATPGHGALLLFQRNRLRVVAKHWSRARLENEFLPAERAWLESLGPGSEQLIAAVHEAYLAHLLGLAELAAQRQHLLGEDPSQTPALAQVLTTLHAVYPLGAAGISGGDPPAAPTFGEMAALAHIQPQPFRSAVPLLGRWIAAFRRRWNRVSTEWYVLPMMQQQSRFNQAALTSVQRLALVLTGYLTGQARQIATLSQEVAALRAELDAQKRQEDC
ncbi:MAG: glycosyltransferase family 2 protein, partial [Anaerolineales bacterium]|nr:glycosyltransferase family 2 protein [Anaerolineales bacterium]